MRKALAVLSTVILLAVSIFGINAHSKTKGVVRNVREVKTNLVIDAGHGGIDAGCIGVDGSLEKIINFDIACNLYDFARVCGLNAFMIRDGDYLFYKSGDDTSKSDLYNRMDFIESIYNSTLISIHQNHFENEAERGMQVWYSPNGDKSAKLADNILRYTKKNLQPDNERLNKMSDDSYYLLHKASVPSVMVECGFMSNREECSLLNSSDYQKKIAYSILSGFCSYICEEL